MSPCQLIRILLMEDNMGQARLAQQTLERAGCVVDWVRDGGEGLTMYRAKTYDVLMVDHDISGKSEIEVLRALAEKGSFPPTVMITANGNEEVAVEAMKPLLCLSRCQTLSVC